LNPEQYSDHGTPEENANALFQTSEGRKLLTLLQNQSENKLQVIASLAKQGSTKEALQLLEPMIKQPEIQQLVRQIQKRHG